MTQPCPRQQREAILPFQREHVSHWDDDGECSYCGSIAPAAVFDAIEKGCKITPTDKNYKIYVDLIEPEPDKLRIVGSANHLPSSGQGKWIRWDDPAVAAAGLEPWTKDGWVMLAPRGPTRHAKFYFQHFSQEERERFVELINERRINFAHPGHFYVLPYFCVPA